jgi:dsRNA-specific ribonuclease
MSENFDRDKTKFWNLYFPPRNDRIPQLKVNHNFDNETLYYASSAKAADAMTEGIVKRMRGEKFFIIECCAGIGGNTTSFLNHPMIHGVRAFERNEKRRLWLKRNIMAYDLGHKAMVPDIDEKGLTSDEDFSNYKEAVFFFDPPWLPPNKKGSDYKKHYILKDMKVGTRTLEQWMIKNKDVASLMVFRVPPKYELNEVPGWTIEIEDMGKNGLVYYCFNNAISGANNSAKTTKKMVDSFEDIRFKDIPFENHGGFGRFVRIQEMCMSDTKKAKTGKSEDPECQVFLKWGFKDPEIIQSIDHIGITEEMLDAESIDIPPAPLIRTDKDLAKTNRVTPEDRIVFHKMFKDLPYPKKGVDILSAQWVADFQMYLKKLLTKFIENESIVNRLIETDKMPLWIRAFTHNTIEVNLNNNYQIPEKIGDSLEASAFFLYLLQNYPEQATPQIYNEAKAQLLSKPFLGDLGQLVKMGSWVRIDSSVLTPSIYEDVFESFSWALHESGDMVKPGLGFMLVRKYMELFLDKIHFDFERAKFGLSKTAFIQRLEQLKIQLDKHEVVALGTGRKQQIILSDEAFEKLSGYFPMIKQKIIGTGEGSSPKEAIEDAYNKALRYIEAAGLTDARVKEIRSEQNLTFLENINPGLVKLVKSKYQKEGYKYVQFENAKEINKYNNTTVILIGYKEDGKGLVSVRLANGNGKNETDARIDACENYLDAI